MLWDQKKRDFGRQHDSVAIEKCLVPALFLCILVGCFAFYITLEQISVKFNDYIRTLKDVIQLIQTQEKFMLAHAKQIRDQQRQTVQQHNALIQDILSQAEVVFADLEMISENNRRRSGQRTRSRSHGLSYAHETARRKMENTVKELWYFVSDQLRQLEELLISYLNRFERVSSSTRPKGATDGKDVVHNVENVTMYLSPTRDPRSASVADDLKMENPTKTTTGNSYMFSNTNQYGIHLIRKQLGKFQKALHGYRRTLFDDLNTLKDVDNAENVRLTMSYKLGGLVQRRLNSMQNPARCEPAETVTCATKQCGFGCNFHHFVYCLITAYATNKSLHLYVSNAWSSLFKPVSTLCPGFQHEYLPFMIYSDGLAQHLAHEYLEPKESDELTEAPQNKSNVHSTLVKFLPLIENNEGSNRNYLPLAVPQDLASKLKIFHGNPAAWWVGQVASFLFNPTEELTDYIKSAEKSINFEKPIVGVHVRRTDKVGIEASFHSLEEYMAHVKDFFDQLERSLPEVRRKVFLATDDMGLLDEAVIKYPDYTFLSVNSPSKFNMGFRDSQESIKIVATDIYFLSRTDFLVCTFSSQVCRLAYELMQTIHGDASQKFRSLDDIYYFGGQNSHVMIATESYKADHYWKGTIDLKKGDKVLVAGNHWNGFSKGKNSRTTLTGLYPSYKVQDQISTFRVHAYP